MKKIALTLFCCICFFTSTTIFSAAKAQTLSYEQIKMAAESGDADAQYALGYMFYYGKSGAPKDKDLAIKWISKAASQKQPQAVKAYALLTAKGQKQSSTPPVASNSEAPKQELANEESPEKLTHKVKEQENMSLVDMRHEKNNDSLNTAEGDYTLQLLGAYNQDKIKAMIKEHHLTQAKIYQTTFNNKAWYVLIYGQYKTRSEAEKEVKRLITELSLQPWIKHYSAVKSYKQIPMSD